MRLSDSHKQAIEQTGHGYGNRLFARQHAFTLIELVTTILIIGILAVVTIPSLFNSRAFDERGFYDQVISTLRYAQKIAIAQRTTACVVFGSNSVTISGVGPTCATPLSPAVSISSSNASFSPTPATFNFNALGTPSASRVISVLNIASSITVEAETGYVH